MKPLHFIASSRDDLCEFPEEVRSEAGYALYLAQMGDKAENACPLLGFGGAKVLEVVINNEGNAYRAVYTVKLKYAVYVLHAFQKKSVKGIATPKPDMDVIRSRLKAAEAHHELIYKESLKEKSR